MAKEPERQYRKNEISSVQRKPINESREKKAPAPKPEKPKKGE